MCVYILLRKFLSLFRHFLWIGCWQDVGCEVLQAVSVGTVKNLSSQYICTHALQVVDAHPAVGFGSPRYAGFNYGRCACRLCGCMCVYILLRKFLSLFRHFLRIGYCQEVCCEVLQAVSVGTVKNLSSQYICTHALQGVDAHPGQILAHFHKNKISGKRERISYESYRNKRNRHRAAYSSKI